jgi:transcriptional regulator with GAF, ATPase, and Fis domain
MKPAPIPANEQERLKELLSLEILDTGKEHQFEDIVQLAAHVCDTPISLISLIDESRQWFKAKVGLEVDETSRDVSFCTHAIAQEKEEVFIVEDAKADSRFHDNPLVTGNPNIHFYASYPLKTSGGHKIGSLCVIDTKHKDFTEAQKRALELLAKQVVKELELRRANLELKRSNQVLQGILGNIPVVAYRINAHGIITEAVGRGLTTLILKTMNWWARMLFISCRIWKILCRKCFKQEKAILSVIPAKTQENGILSIMFFRTKLTQAA